MSQIWANMSKYRAKIEARQEQGKGKAGNLGRIEAE